MNEQLPAEYRRVKEVAAQYGLAPASIYRAIKEGRIPAVKLGTSGPRAGYFVRPVDVGEAFAEVLRSRDAADRGLKHCNGCDKDKPFPDAFYLGQSKCKPCHDELTLEWRATHAEQHAETVRRLMALNIEKRREARKRWYAKQKGDPWLRNRYGITLAEYERILNEQAGGCAICGSPPPERKRLAVDHCHDALHIRGILCSNCNTGIGAFRDDPDLLRKAIEYLAKDPVHPGKSQM